MSEKKSKKKTKSTKEREDGTRKTREERRAEKAALMELVPKVDDDGTTYTKLQIRRMMKRVKRGLPPVPTEEEMREMRKRETTMKREEEDELAGLIYTRDDKVKAKNDDESQDEPQDNVYEHDEEGDNHHDGDDNDNDQSFDEKLVVPQSNSRKRKQRNKPVPEDYVCLACQNTHKPAHWIYDCPEKVTVKGTNHVSKKLRGIHAPDSRKVFVSGLAFTMKKRDVEELFRECGKITSVKLFTFKDTGRCKGQAFITFETDESAKKAIKLSGTTITNDEQKATNKGDKKDESPKRKELRLKVTRKLSRAVTKAKKSS